MTHRRARPCISLGDSKITLEGALGDRKTITPTVFFGQARLNGRSGSVEWAVAWPEDEDEFFNSYCNTVPTPMGGTHETGLRGALTKGLRGYGELINNKQAAKIIADDVVGGANIMLSVFIPEPQFQGQTKEKLASIEATKLVETSLGDHFDLWLSSDPETAKRLLEHTVERSPNTHEEAPGQEPQAPIGHETHPVAGQAIRLLPTI